MREAAELSPHLQPEATETKAGFLGKLEARWAQGKFACVGLDSDYAQIPQSLKDRMSSLGLGDDDLIAKTIAEFNVEIIAATHDFVCAYKPNIAFYEAYKEAGLRGLDLTMQYLRMTHPGIPVILDAKRGDIGNTNSGYAISAFDRFQADAITVNPYFGGGSLKPFSDREDRGIVVLVRTSNPEAAEIQDLPVDISKLPQEYKDRFGDLSGLRDIEGTDIIPLYRVIAYAVSHNWKTKGSRSIVVGATYPGELEAVRKIVGKDMPILIPGVGAQGGDLEKAVMAGGRNIILNSARGIIFASKGEDFAEAAGREAKKLNGEIRRVLREKHVNDILESTGAILTDGHFLLASGKHSEKYINKDAVYPHKREIEELCSIWAEEFKEAGVEVVVGPVMGGVILSHETARLLTKLTGKPVFGVYAEKSHDTQLNDFAFTRGYDGYVRGKKVLVVEDILSTGHSVASVVRLVKEAGGEVVGVGAIANRGNVKPEDIGVDKLYSLTNIQMESWVPQECPRCEKGIPINNKIGRGKQFPPQPGP